MSFLLLQPKRSVSVPQREENVLGDRANVLPQFESPYLFHTNRTGMRVSLLVKLSELLAQNNRVVDGNFFLMNCDHFF